jgi:putative acetyltransferase
VHARATDGRITLVAVNSSDQVIAYGDLEKDGHIDHLYCVPNVAGAGVASKLLDELLARAASVGISRLYTEASEIARGLFERNGFALVCRRDFDLHGVSIHNYAMERTLA